MTTSEPAPTAPHELLDDGFAPDPCELLVIGCGNILRGDDAVGPVLVRTLFERGVPDGVRLIDGGTAGMDVAFAMRGAGRVVLVDAARTEHDPGTVFRVPADQLTDVPPLSGLHSHNFRWDHALALAHWLLGPSCPTDITVFLIEADRLDPGAPLTPAVEAGMCTVIEAVERDFYPPGVRLTDSGYLRIPAALAEHRFPAGVCVARREGEDLLLLPLRDAANGGLILKQSSPDGERSVLIHEVLGFSDRVRTGPLAAEWDDGAGALRVRLRGAGAVTGVLDGDRGAHGGGARTRPVGGVPGDRDPGRGGAAAAADPALAQGGRAGGRRDPADGVASPRPAAGPARAATGDRR